MNSLATLALALMPQMSSHLPTPPPPVPSWLNHDPFRDFDRSRIVVHCEGVPAESGLREWLATEAVRVIENTEFGLEGYRLLELEGTRSRARLAALVDRVSLRNGVLFASLVYRDERGELTYPTPYLYVKFRSGAPEAAQHVALQRVPELQVVETALGGTDGIYRVRSAAPTGRRVLGALARLQRLPGVEFAGSDRVMTMIANGSVTPDDPHFPDQWGIRNTGQTVNGIVGVPDTDIDADEVWTQTTGDPSILIVVLDVGVQQDHPDINQIGGMDFTDQAPGDGGPRNACDRHGTAMAGIITAPINTVGIAGVAPSCRVASARIAKSILSCNGSATVLPSWVQNGINWSVTIGARVTNMSNSVGYDPLIDTAYEIARNAGVINFAASGNTGPTNGIEYPSSSTHVRAVGAILADGAVRSNSNRVCSMFGGDCIDFVAPGDDIWTTDLTSGGYDSGSDYASVSGTSPACAFASGIAALMLSVKPAATEEELYALMYFGCDHPFDYDDALDGGGLLNAGATAHSLGDVYVDYQAGPGGNGSIFSPFQTVAQGVAAASPGDVVIVWFGTYPENITISKAIEIHTYPAAGGSLILGQ